MDRTTKIAIMSVAGAAIGIFGIYLVMKHFEKRALAPLSACPVAASSSGTGADTGYGQVADMAYWGSVTGESGGKPVYIGTFLTTWSADLEKKELVIDAPRNISWQEGQSTLAAASTIRIQLPGWEDSAVNGSNIPTTKYTYTLGDGSTTCLSVALEKDVGGPGIWSIAITKDGGGDIPAKTALPAMRVPLIPPSSV